MDDKTMKRFIAEVRRYLVLDHGINAWPIVIEEIYQGRVPKGITKDMARKIEDTCRKVSGFGKEQWRND